MNVKYECEHGFCYGVHDEYEIGEHIYNIGRVVKIHNIPRLGIGKLADLIIMTSNQIYNQMHGATITEIKRAIEEDDGLLSEGFSTTIFNLLLPFIMQRIEHERREENAKRPNKQ